MRGVPMNAQFRGNMRGSVRHGVPMRPGAPMRGGVFRGPMRGGPMNGNRGVPMRPGIRPMNVGPRPLPGKCFNTVLSDNINIMKTTFLFKFYL